MKSTFNLQSNERQAGPLSPILSPPDFFTQVSAKCAPILRLQHAYVLQESRTVLFSYMFALCSLHFVLAFRRIQVCMLSMQCWSHDCSMVSRTPWVDDWLPPVACHLSLWFTVCARINIKSSLLRSAQQHYGYRVWHVPFPLAFGLQVGLFNGLICNTIFPNVMFCYFYYLTLLWLRFKRT